MFNAFRALTLAAVTTLSLLAAKSALADEPVECKAQGDPMYQGLSKHGIPPEKVGQKECFEYTAAAKEWSYGHNFQHYGPNQHEADQRVREGMCQYKLKDGKKFFKAVNRKDDGTLICRSS